MAEINHYLSDDEAFKLDVVSVRLVKAKEPVESDEQLTSPEAVVRALAGEMAWYDREVVGVINFDTKMRPVNVNFVSAGALDYSLAHPREILKSAMLSNAASMMMIHNHPSQDLTPSRADVEITDRMVRLGELAGIPLLDHIIIGKNGREYFSFAEKKAMPVIKLQYKSSYEKIDFSHVAENEENFSVNVSRLSEALDETNTILESTSGQHKNVTDSVTNRIPDTIEDGIVKYFDSLDEKAQELINNAIENNMPDIFIRQMFTMDYKSMKEFYEEYFK